MDEQELDVERLAAGDRRAADAFLELARGFARRYFRKPSHINSAAQSALTEMLRKLATGYRPEHPRYWALTSVSNSVRRDLTRFRRLHVQFESQVHTRRELPSASDVHHAREQLALVDALLDEHGSDTRKAVLGLAEGRTAESIARELNIEPGAVRTKASRARKRLREQLIARRGRETIRRRAVRLWCEQVLGAPVHHVRSDESSATTTR